MLQFMKNIRTFNELCKRANFPIYPKSEQPDTDMLTPSNFNALFG
jgi:hypothetical protein